MTDQVKLLISGYLSLDPKLAPFWDIIDSYPKEKPELVLVHYNDEMDPDNREHEALLDIRGIVIDLNTGATISNAFGYEHELVCDGPIEEDAENILVPAQIKTYFSDFNDNPSEEPKLSHGVQKFPKSDTAMFLRGESTVFRFFKWKGIVFSSTYRKINAGDSRWGGRATFRENFNRLMPGFSPEMLFGPEEYNPFTHVFLINDINTRIISSVRQNRVFYLAMFKSWEESKYPQYASGPIAPQALPAPTFPEPEPFSGIRDAPMRIQVPITIELANKYLFPRQFATPVPPEHTNEVEQYELVPIYSPYQNTILDICFKDPGYDTSDDRLSGGDSIALYTRGQSGKTRIYKIDSPSVPYRAMVTGNDPVPYHKFVVTAPEFTTGNVDDLKQTYPLYTFDGNTLHLNRPDERRKWWWSIFYDAVSPDFKNEADGYMTRYQKDLERVANFIIRDRSNLSDEEKKIVNEKTRQRFDNLYTVAQTGKQGPFRSLVDLLYKETGNSMYKMITTIRNIEKYRSRASTVIMPSAPEGPRVSGVSFGL